MSNDNPNQTHTDISHWIENASLQHPNIDRALIETACTFAEKLSENSVSPYTTSTLDQGLKMATLLLDLNCDNQTLAAAILYPSVYYAQPNKETLTQTLNTNITKLIYGAVRMEAIHDMHRQSSDLNPQQIDNLRKMLLAIIDDVRIVLIKLAERLITLENLKTCTDEQKQYVANQVINFYAPLANRLGIGQLKWQLEDLAFRFLEPDKYFAISKVLNMRRTDREEFIKTMMSEITTLMNQANIVDFSLSGRAKHIYSIYKKAQRKNVPIKEIYDALALRILLPTVKDCYTALSLAHEKWQHIDSEFDDYIANPKGNGYQSIHTAIVSPESHNVEIQIRTYQMHEAAELGVAAHWKYKEGGSEKESYEDKIERLRELMSWQQEVTADEDDNVYESLFADRIYVFTPKGDVFDMPAGSTPLDFAYHIHTAIGNRTRGAKVNGKMVTLQHPLKTGDRVDIITSKKESPSRDWMNKSLGYLKTASAIQKVRHWFKKENYDHDLHLGVDIWEKANRQAHLTKADLNKVARHFNVKAGDDLLVAIGSGNLGVSAVISQIKSQKETAQSAPQQQLDIPLQTPKKTAPSGSSPLVVEGVGNLLTHLAKCCKPIPGDNIIGYITTGRGVTIHQRCCRNIQHDLLTRPQRVIDVAWHEKFQGNYPVDFTIIADDRSGLARDISGVIANEKLGILGLTSHLDRHSNQATIYMSIEINADTSIAKLIGLMTQVSSVIKVSRN